MKITALILVVLVAAALAAPPNVVEVGVGVRPRLQRAVTYVDATSVQRDTVAVAPQPQAQRTGAFVGATDAWKVAVTGALDLFTAGRPSGVGV